MENSRVLIVSDSPDRRNFLQYFIKSHGMTPIMYPNVFAAEKALMRDPFVMIVVDFSIPIEPKLALIKGSGEHQPKIRVFTLGKLAWLKKEAPLPDDSSVISMDSIESFPDMLSEDMNPLEK